MIRLDFLAPSWEEARRKTQEAESDDVKIDFAWKSADDIIGSSVEEDVQNIVMKVLKFDKPRWHVSVSPYYSYRTFQRDKVRQGCLYWIDEIWGVLMKK